MPSDEHITLPLSDLSARSRRRQQWFGRVVLAGTLVATGLLAAHYQWSHWWDVFDLIAGGALGGWLIGKTGK